MIGGGPQLLTHYYDDARTMYQVFRRGLSISGEGAVGVKTAVAGAGWVQGWVSKHVPGTWQRSRRFSKGNPLLTFLLPLREAAALCGEG